MQTTAMRKEAGTKTETHAKLAVAQGDSVALAALPRRRSSAAWASPDSELGGRRRCSHFIIINDHFFARENTLVDRPKPFSNLHLRRVVGRDAGVERSASRATAILGQSDLFADGVSTSNSAVGLPPRPSECVPVVFVE